MSSASTLDWMGRSIWKCAVPWGMQAGFSCLIAFTDKRTLNDFTYIYSFMLYIDCELLPYFGAQSKLIWLQNVSNSIIRRNFQIWMLCMVDPCAARMVCAPSSVKFCALRFEAWSTSSTWTSGMLRQSFHSYLKEFCLTLDLMIISANLATYSQRQRFEERRVGCYHFFIRRMRKSQNHLWLQMVWKSTLPQCGNWHQPRRPCWWGSHGCACRASEACSGNTNDNEAGSQVWPRYVYLSFETNRLQEASLERIFMQAACRHALNSQSISNSNVNSDTLIA